MDKTMDGPGLFSINPFLPGYEYIPDGEPRIFGDRLYLYGSHDEAGAPFCCTGDYVCWSAPAKHPVHWRFEGTIYRRAQDPYVRKMMDTANAPLWNTCLFAPDVAEVDGAYYLYYGVGMSPSGLAVARAESPTGPFKYQPIAGVHGVYFVFRCDSSDLLDFLSFEFRRR